MSIALSILFGLEGKYNLCGVDINFIHTKHSTHPMFKNYHNPHTFIFGKTLFTNATHYLLSTPMIQLASFGYLHVFIHEMGHALADKLYGHSSQRVEIFTNICAGCAVDISPSIFVGVAGPILSTVWEIAKLTAAIALSIILPPFIGFPLGIFLGIGSAFWIFGELAYACSRQGDWAFLRHY